MQDLMRFIPALVDQLENNEIAREAFVFASWRRSVGDGLRDKTAPLALDGERLRVAVRDETWKRHLESMASQLVFKVNSFLRARYVTFIDLVVDEEAVLEDARGRGDTADSILTAEDSKREITEEIRAAADNIGDPELRERFLLAAGASLARRKLMGP
jgi:hypothetical protein